uniref:Uncharacterized protein n=1 Tax=Onchocerca volvulus TaxID=6282 RepID=A0A8R1TRY9_ONCVO
MCPEYTEGAEKLSWSCQRTNQPSSLHYRKPDFERAEVENDQSIHPSIHSSIHRPQLSSFIHFAGITPLPHLYMTT